MPSKSRRQLWMGFLILTLFATSIEAAPITFQFTFRDAGSGATATGSITYEDTLVNNPGSNSYALPNPAVLALTVTVSGAPAGNGTFGISDFNQVVFRTGENGLDFSAQLVGQPTGSGPWGPAVNSVKSYLSGEKGDNGLASDFNLFIPSFKSTFFPPTGVGPFTLRADAGSGVPMALISKIALGVGPPTSVPALSTWSILLMVLVLLAGAAYSGVLRPLFKRN